ncbi:MAG: hypothetical protein V3V57_16770 [Spirochaetia bacterium]
MKGPSFVLSIFLVLSGGLAGTGCSSDASRNEPVPAFQQERSVDNSVVSGKVVDEHGDPVEFAIVRIQATTIQCLTDGQGHFSLPTEGQTYPFTVSAWKDKHYCAKQENVVPATSNLRLLLRRYQTTDNPHYEWVPPMGEGSCYSCKPGVTQVWLDNDAHARSATNIRFLTMYNGTDAGGSKSPDTRYTKTRDYGQVPIPPDPKQPYYGPGYKLDFPGSDGNCAACHVPGAAVDAPYGTDPNAAAGVDRFGIHCDFCHKIADVELDPRNGLPYPNMPGVLSLDIRRPFPEDPERFQLFFGTFDDDNVPEEDTRLPLIEQSQFCAACHYGMFWNTVIYNSFGEWLDSPYSDPISGQTCQNCHMPAPTIYKGKPITNVAPNGMGGVERDPLTIHAHTFPGAADVELLQNSVTMDVGATLEGQTIVVEVRITNDRTGHHVPTDSPLRHLILLVEARDTSGQLLELIEGGILPEWCGIGDPQLGYYGGLPGRAFAKVLMELWTEVSPSGSYWNQTFLVSDNRLPAFAEDISGYVFAIPAGSNSGSNRNESGDGGGSATVSVRLLYRRAFIELADQKGWDLEDILMEETEIPLP